MQKRRWRDGRAFDAHKDAIAEVENSHKRQQTGASVFVAREDDNSDGGLISAGANVSADGSSWGNKELGMSQAGSQGCQWKSRGSLFEITRHLSNFFLCAFKLCMFWFRANSSELVRAFHG